MSKQSIEEVAELRRLIAGLADKVNGKYRNLPVTAGTMEVIAKYLARLLPHNKRG